MASTADEDARANVLRSLGVARRRAPGGGTPDAADGDAAAGEAAPDDGDGSGGADSADGAGAAEGATNDAGADGAAAAGATIPGLGIRRRKPATGERPAAQVDGEASTGGGGVATGLGIKRRKGTDGTDAAPAGTTTDAEEEEPQRPLGSDQTAVILGNYFRARPKLELPERVWKLKRTHGFYTGDGRAERKLFLGFEPALVLYVLPVYPEELPKVVKQGDEWVSIDPGLHRQPRFTSDGFIVDKPYNEKGESYVYVAFRSDGQPLEPPGASLGAAEPKRSATTGLGIRRRK